MLAFSYALLAVAGMPGLSLAAADVLYKDTADSNQLKLASWLAGATLIAATVCGIALNGGGAGQRVDFVQEDPNLIITSTLPFKAGLFVFLSGLTAGKFAVTFADYASNAYPTLLGAMKAAGVMNMKIFSPGVTRP